MINDLHILIVVRKHIPENKYLRADPTEPTDGRTNERTAGGRALKRLVATTCFTLRQIFWRSDYLYRYAE